MSRNKTATLIALFMISTVAATIVTFLPTAKADNVYTSYVYCAVSPADWVGVGQDVALVMWTAEMPPDTGEIAAAEGGERAAWYNVGFYVTDPEGDTETLTIEKTDPVGGGFVIYTPDQVGTYTVQAWFPETTKELTEDYIDSYGTFYPAGFRFSYSAAVSPEVTFTVQEEQREPWPEAPLPSGYWTRPINQASRDWYVLAGNWMGLAGWTGSEAARPVGEYGGTTERFVYGEGTESAHILWTKPYYVGGIMDERYGDTGYQTGHYQGLSFEAIVINGQIYYAYRADAHVTEGYLIVDLYTGETLRYVNDTMPSKGQIYNYESPNQHGGYAYMWKTGGVTLPPGWISEPGKQTWEMLDAYTGKSICKVANITFGYEFWGFIFGAIGVYGKDGSICNYMVNDLAPWGSPTPDYYLQIWNNTAIPTMLGAGFGTSAWQWRPSGGAFGDAWPDPPTYNGYYIHDGNLGYSLNVSVPASYVAGGSIQTVREGEYVIIGSAGSNDETGVVKGKMTCLSLETGSEGDFMWSTEFTPPSSAGNVSISLTGVYPEDGVICFSSSDLLKRWGYSIDTGAMIWESDPEPQMNYYSMYSNYYKGMLLSPSWGGVILAYNITTGDIIWNYTAPTVGWESPYGNYPINIFAICDDKIYTLTGEHSISQPMYRGPNLRCINATNGEEIWKILGFSANGGASLGGQYAQMGDGKVLALNYFDNQIYCFGPGPSATTVTASPSISVHGNSVMITGTVTDQTETGRRNTNDMFDFSLKGTPAISDEDMGAWMEYMFMQQGMPADATGVEVILETVDPNGNFYEIGRTTSDITGTYSLKFTPDVPGDYQIIARFEGSAAYGSSFAHTYINVEDAPVPTPTPTPTPAPMTDTYVIGIGAGAIVAIIVIGLVIILMLRKR
jgi:hypothetical protein